MPQGIAKERPGNESRLFLFRQPDRPRAHPSCFHGMKSKSFSEKCPDVMGCSKNMAIFVEQ